MGAERRAGTPGCLGEEERGAHGEMAMPDRLPAVPALSKQRAWVLRVAGRITRLGNAPDGTASARFQEPDAAVVASRLRVRGKHSATRFSRRHRGGSRRRKPAFGTYSASVPPVFVRGALLYDREEADQDRLGQLAPAGASIA